MIRTYLINDSGYNSSFSAAMASGFAKSPQRSALATPPGFLLALLVSLEKPKFRFRRIYEISSRRIVLVALFSVIVSLLASGVAWAADFVWPVEGKVLRQFGKDEFGNHGGIDIEASQGTRVKAAVSGVVTNVGLYKEGSPWPFDNTVTVKYGNEGYDTTYLQIRPLVSEGQSVEQGQEIGEVITSTNRYTSAAHLHFGVRNESGNYEDPLSFLPGIVSEPVRESAQESSAVSQAVSDSTGAQPTLTDQPSPVSAGAAAVVTTTPSVAGSEIPAVAQPVPRVEQVSPSDTTVMPGRSEGVTATASPESVSPAAVTKELVQPSPAVLLAAETKVLTTQAAEPGKAVAASSPTAKPSPTVISEPAPEIGVVLDLPASAGRQIVVAVKDRQIEALGPTPATSQKSPRPLSEEHQTPPKRGVQGGETIAINTDPAVITRLFPYLLLIMSTLIFTRAFKLRPGPTAQA